MKFNLRRCVWEITLACCFSCKYCGSKGGKARENELTTEECLNVADQLAELGCRRVSMIGGEVFMRRDWKEIVGRLAAHDISVNIITNGFLFTESLLADLKSLRIESVSVSLDGPKEVHDKYRQEGSYDRALAALAALSAGGIPTSVISTLNAENVQTLPALYETLCNYPIFAWQLQACSPMGNAANSGIDYAFDPREVIRFVTEHMRTAPFMLGVADNIGYFTPDEGSIRGNMSGTACFGGCRAGISAIGIDSIGNVRGCESMYDERFNEGNLREKSLREIWEDEDAFAYNRKFDKSMLTGPCASCAQGPFCAGGCRSYNFFTHGKLYEAPRCARAMDAQPDK
ncbi:MAG: radical SAM protein [Lachnospiraceae bacterium]|nr:radical SAM protein [Lachnospiraceae bacterium]